ncbi:MAG: hypothetical protein C4527_19360 [Candidatus Omnitrophota bacterium]|jgi:hypothetical protein|nr:MAG: hypothetical protein C4527_19360 [Candidatus Omnitrophota bacterium]
MEIVYLTPDIIHFLVEREDHVLQALLDTPAHIELVTSLKIFKRIIDELHHDRSFGDRRHAILTRFRNLFLNRNQKRIFTFPDCLNNLNTAEEILVEAIYRKAHYLLAGPQLDFSPYYNKTFGNLQVMRPIQYIHRYGLE